MGLEPVTADLTDMQATFVKTYMDTGDISKASLEAGYSSATTGYAVLKSAKVQRAIREAQVRILESEAGTMAIRTVMDLMKPTFPPNVRLGAAGLAGKWAGFADRPEAGQQKAMTDMSKDELEAFIAKLDGVISDRAESAVPAVITGVSHVVEGS